MSEKVRGPRAANLLQNDGAIQSNVGEDVSGKTRG